MTAGPHAPLTDPVREQTGTYRVPMLTHVHWSRMTDARLTRNLGRRAGSPWGRLAAAAAVGYLFVFRPTTWESLAAVALLVAVTAAAKERRWVYLLPAAAVGVQMGSVEWAVGAFGALLGGWTWASNSDRPDPAALRVHLALAELTGAPTKERYKRWETFNEAYNRITFTGRASVVRGQFRRLRVPDERPLDPVPQWIRIDYTPPEVAYPVAGVFFAYPPTSKDADLAWRQTVLNALAHKLPKDPTGAVPGIIGEWHEDEDWCYARVARPMPTWVDAADLPELPWRDTIPLGAASPDAPMVVEVEGFPVALWNFDSDEVAREHRITPEPNAIVIGPPGSFKTTAGRTICNGALNPRYLGARLRIIDGKREGAFAYLHDHEGVTETADPLKGKQLVLDTHAEMEARYAVNERRRREGGPKVRYRPILLVVDEGMSWLDQLAVLLDGPDLEDLMVKLVDISRKGRTARIGIVWLTQRPDVKGVAKFGTVGQMRDSLGLKLAGAGISETGARMVFGDSNGALANAIPKVPRARMGMMVGNDFQLIQLAHTPDPLDRPDPDLGVEWVDLASQQPEAQPPTPPAAQPADGGQPRGRVVTP